MTAWRTTELRAIALVRSRLSMVGVAGLGALALAAAFGVALEGDARMAAVLQVLLTGGLLLTLILAHGMISNDLRSGVAMLWLQKPVRPVVFYAMRGIEVSFVALLLVAALCGAAVLLLFVMGATEVSRTALDAAPVLLLFSLFLCAMVFGFSGWGVPLDSLVVVVVCSAGLYWVLARFEPGPDPALLPWFLPPLDDLRTLADAIRGDSVGGVGGAILMSARFLLLWGLIGLAGLCVTTRSPLPRDSSR